MKESVSSAANKQFALSGPAGPVDRRVTPVRGDLACLSLAGHIFAPHYVEGMTFHCIAPHAPLHVDANADSAIVSELLASEPFLLLDRIGDWAWGQLPDGSCGFVDSTCLAEGKGTIAVPEADNAAAYAEAAFGAPYAPGGQGGAGYCAAGLLRRAALAAGVDLPAFTDLQAMHDALKVADAPEAGILLFAGDIAAICISDSEAITALPEQGVVKIAISELLSTAEAEPQYRAIAQ